MANGNTSGSAGGAGPDVAIGGLASGDTGPWTLGMLLISLALIGGLLGLAVDR